MKTESTNETQSAEAKRLRELYNEKKGDLSQEEFGHRYGIGSQGMVWQYLNGHRPLNLKAAIGFANGLGVSLEEVSQEIAEQVAMASRLCGMHDGLPSKTKRKNFPDDVSTALQAVLTAFRTGSDISNADIRVIISYALAPVESGNMTRSSKAPASHHEQAIMDRAIEAINRAGGEHVERVKEPRKKRH